MSAVKSEHAVTGLLRAWSQGDQKALEELMPLVYGELHRVASGYLRQERSGHTLQTTALIHEAYFRLIGQNVNWQNRAHFLGVAAQAMRRVLVDYGRGQKAAKRGGPDLQIGIEDAEAVEQPRALDIIALDRALERLSAFDERQARIVELRYFGGLTIQETAQTLGVSPATVKDDWSLAKAWLYREMAQG
jgi:RNA polymerase sigma factor (TIGR02999 family)